MKLNRNIRIRWSSEFAYAIGLLVTDGSLSKDGRHIDFTSKDRIMVTLFKKCLGLNNKIGRKTRGKEKIKKYFRVQCGDTNFYKFLLSIGLTPRKSKTIQAIRIPKKYFFDFLRGHFDGDGTFYSYWDPRWKSSFMFYTVFVSASRKHIIWLQREICTFLNIKGYINSDNRRTIYYLRYAKKESVKLLEKIYSCYTRRRNIFLPRKYLKIKKALHTLNARL